MAKKAKKTTSKQTASESSTKITRISAKDTVKNTPKVAKVSSKEPKQARKSFSVLSPLLSLVGYFKGAWFELRQVRWPNRRATWSLTGAVLIFSAFFVVLILLLDVLFKFLFEQILG